MSEDENKTKCEDCKYYKCTPQEGRDPKAFGQCRKYAPRWSPQFAVAVPQHAQLKYLNNGWPIVASKSWCGEFEQKP